MSQRSPFNQRNAPAASSDDKAEKKSGIARRSAASAKPAREAAQSVRVAPATKKGGKGVPAKPKTKEERKAARRAEREEEDRVATISNILLRKDEDYVKYRRVWWFGLGAGIVCTFASFGFMNVPGASGRVELGTAAGNASVVALVLAYVFIIGAFIYDFVKIRPIRNAYMQKAAGMSEKKRQAVVDAQYAEEEKKRAEKAAKKSARKGGK